MRALVFGVTRRRHGSAPGRREHARAAPAGHADGHRARSTTRTPIGPDWVVLQTRLCGICGSDTKQVFMDTGGDWPDAGDDRVHLVPAGPRPRGGRNDRRGRARRAASSTSVSGCCCSAGCRARPRGITPVCPACEAGDFALCWNFLDGRLAPGIHVGNSSDATGRLRRARARALVDGDPDARRHQRRGRGARRSVRGRAALDHAHSAAGGRQGRRVGCGRAGHRARSRCCARCTRPSRWRGRAHARATSARVASSARTTSSPSDQEPEAIVVALAEWSGGVLRTPWDGLPIAHPGFVDNVYDTIGQRRQTVEQALRVMKAAGLDLDHGRERARAVRVVAVVLQRGPHRRLERVRHRGGRRRAQARDRALPRHGARRAHRHLARCSRTRSASTSGAQAFTTLARQDETGAIKVAFDYR